MISKYAKESYKKRASSSDGALLLYPFTPKPLQVSL